MTRSPRNRYMTLAQRYWSLLVANGLILLFFAWIAVYIKLANLGNAPERERRFQVLVDLFQDPFSRTRPYLGLLTSVSEILWCVIVTLCLVTVVTLWRLRQHRRLGGRFLLTAGCFMGVLLLDEVLRITLLLNKLAGIPKSGMYLVYLLGAVAIAVQLGRYVRQATPYPLLLITGGLFIVSAMADTLPLPGQGSLILLEDGTKLLGLVNLLAYFWQVSQTVLIEAISRTVTHQP